MSHERANTQVIAIARNIAASTLTANMPQPLVHLASIYRTEGFGAEGFHAARLMLLAALSEAHMTTENQTHSGLGALGAGGVIGLLGATSVGIAVFAPDTPALEVGLIFAAAALVEFVAGISLYRHGGAGISPLFAGASGLAMVSMLFFYWWIVPQSRSASTVTMLFGIFCISTAVVRVLDLVFDRPVASLSESIAAMTSLAVGVIALSWWNEASVFLSAWLVGVELLATALAVSGAAWAHWVHPDQSGYEDPLPH